MIVHDVRQGTPAWDRLRLGIPTASNFHRMILEEPPYPDPQDVLTDDGQAWVVTSIEDTEIIAKVPRG